MARWWPLPPLRPTIDAALRDTTSKDERYRAMAAEALGGAPEERASEAKAALFSLLADRAPQVRWSAIAALGALGGKDIVSTLGRSAEDPDPSVRIAVLDALCRVGNPECADLVVRAASDPSAVVREASTTALVHLAGPAALPRLLELAKDSAPGVRAAAAACLGGYEGEARLALLRLLEDPDLDVRAEAAFALAPLGERRATPLLLSLLRDRHVERDAAEALGHLGDPEAVPALRRLLGRWLLNPWTRVAAAAALARLGDPDGARSLVEILSRKRHDAVALAAEEAAALGLAEAREPIRWLAAHPPRALGSAPFEKALEVLDAKEIHPEAR